MHGSEAVMTPIVVSNRLQQHSLAFIEYTKRCLQFALLPMTPRIIGLALAPTMMLTGQSRCRIEVKEMERGKHRGDFTGWIICCSGAEKVRYADYADNAAPV